MCRRLFYFFSFVFAFIVAVPLCSTIIVPIDSVVTDNPSGSPPYKKIKEDQKIIFLENNNTYKNRS